MQAAPPLKGSERKGSLGHRIVKSDSSRGVRLYDLDVKGCCVAIRGCWHIPVIRGGEGQDNADCLSSIRCYHLWGEVGKNERKKEGGENLRDGWSEEGRKSNEDGRGLRRNKGIKNHGGKWNKKDGKQARVRREKKEEIEEQKWRERRERRGRTEIKQD